MDRQHEGLPYLLLDHLSELSDYLIGRLLPKRQSDSHRAHLLQDDPGLPLPSHVHCRSLCGLGRPRLLLRQEDPDRTVLGEQSARLSRGL